GAINDILVIPARLSQVFPGDLSADAFLPFRSGKTVTLWNQGHRLKQYNFYFQDEWRVRRNVTLNYGLRWEINPAPSEAAGRVYVPDRPIAGGQGPVTFRKTNRWFERNNVAALAPRFGITWSPNSKLVIRSGYGIAFDPISSFQVTAVSGRVPGLTFSCSSTVGGATTPGCATVPDVRIGQGFPLELPPPNTKPSSFLNSTTTQSDLTLNAAGNFAGRVEQTTLAAKLRPNQQFAIITYIDSGGDSYYHSGQATLRKRFSGGLLAGIAYTYGKSIDDQSVDPVGASSGGGLTTMNSRTPTDTRDWRQERGRSDFDRRPVFL